MYGDPIYLSKIFKPGGLVSIGMILLVLWLGQTAVKNWKKDMVLATATGRVQTEMEPKSKPI